MNFLSWCLSIALLLVLLMEAVDFQQVLICRQKAWLVSTEIQTRSLLKDATDSAKGIVPSCQIIVGRNKSEVSWKYFTSMSSHKFILNLRGKL